MGKLLNSLGKTLADKNIRLVYGGGNVGLMGITADSTMQHGGEVLGIIPGFLNQLEVGHNGITELRVVENMHQRKLMMHKNRMELLRFLADLERWKRFLKCSLGDN